MVGVTNKINYYCCRIFRGAPAPTAPMVLTPVLVKSRRTDYKIAHNYRHIAW